MACCYATSNAWRKWNAPLTDDPMGWDGHSYGYERAANPPYGSRAGQQPLNETRTSEALKSIQRHPVTRPSNADPAQYDHEWHSDTDDLDRNG